MTGEGHAEAAQEALGRRIVRVDLYADVLREQRSLQPLSRGLCCARGC